MPSSATRVARGALAARLSRFFAIPALLAAAVPLWLGCESSSPQAAVDHAPGAAGADRAPAAPPPLFTGMGNHRRPVTVTSDQARRYFDQGLIWAFAFNHDEAIRSFRYAAELDPQCAMAWWGVALCNGPHINFPMMPPARSAAAWEALQNARALASGGSEVEQALIDALGQRYAAAPPEDRRPLDEAYAAAMKTVWQRFPDDADVGTLYAESLMDLQPWDLWDRDGQPKGNTNEILGTLETVLRLNPNHPGANHLYIHCVEASPFPERGIASADRLRTAVPAAGHLLHMPAHIDVQTGRWKMASDCNLRAIASDVKYRELSPKQGFYRLYMAHNHHFLAFSEMMQGREASAMKAAREMIAGVPESFLKTDAAVVDPVMPIALEVQMRFGRWDDILAEPAPSALLPITTAKWRFARAVANAAKGDVAAATEEQERFRAAVRAIPAGALMMINPADKVMAVADLMLAGEIAYRAGKIDEAVDQLTRAVAIEDELMYMEPPDWIQPVRHTLGAVLVDARRFKEAEEVYRQDLHVWPENGWSLRGLATCLQAAGNTAEAAHVEARFKKVWAGADQPIATSCLCVQQRK